MHAEKRLGGAASLPFLLLLSALAMANLLHVPAAAAAADSQLSPLASDGLLLPVFAESAEDAFPELVARMAGKKAILLGDASHGTEEFYAFRKQVTRQLIRAGLRAVVLEAEWDSARLFDAYIRGLLPAETDPREMLAAAFFRWPEWVWANEEMVEFALWLKDFNSRLPPAEMVRCHGMDMQQAVAAALDALAPLWPADSSPGAILKKLDAWWQPYRERPIDLNTAYAAGRETGSLLASELLLALPSPEPEVQALLAMLVAAEQYYRTMSYDYYGAWNIRSRYFSWFVQQILTRPEGRNGVAVWAHNSHVGDMAGGEVGESGLINVGHLLRQAFGAEQIFILGTAGYAGTVLAAPEWGEEVREVAVPPAWPDSFESLLANSGWQNPLLLWETPEQAARWSTLPMLHRGIGVVYQPESEGGDNYLISRIGERYDALVFWNETRALQPLRQP